MYKILSIDGGGVHGYSSLIFLQRLLKEKPDLLEKVDLIAGTSIGGILGLGLAMEHGIEFVIENFLNGIPLAFDTDFFRTAGFTIGLNPKYKIDKFKKFLTGVYNDMTLKDLKKKVVIPAFQLDTHSRFWKAKIFHNFDGPTADPDVKVLDVALSTSAVPVYFPTYDKYVDGGVVSTNPSMIAAIQTQDINSRIYPKPNLNDLAILSLGTMTEDHVQGTDLQWGYLSWIQPILQIATQKDIIVVDHQCKVLFGERYHRMESIISGPMDNFSEIDGIKKISEDYPIEKTVSWLKGYWY
jgi:patatin-like phospholipase/acyl hydrolase